MKTITILLIEDNTQDIRLINEMLKEIKSFSYKLITSATLKEGIEKIHKNKLDIILLDLNLPDSTGQHTFNKVIDFSKEIPIVLVTGNEDHELSLKLIMEGAQDYITKQSLNPSPLEKSILYSIERQALLSNIKLKNAQIESIEKERILLAKFPSEDPDPVLRVAINGKLLYINEAGIELLPNWQLKKDEIIPSWLKDIIDFIIFDRINVEFELHHLECNYLFYAVPLFEEGYINLYGRDITKHNQAEGALRESEEKHRTIIQSAIDGFWMVNMQGQLMEVNEAYCRMSGYSEHELLTMSVTDLEAIETTDYVAEHLQKIRTQGESRFETKHRRKDGSIFDVEVSAQYQFKEDEWFVSFIKDITDRKLGEQKLIVANKELSLQNEEKEKQAAELINSKQLLDETARLARVGGWEIILKSNELYWSDEVYYIHEVDNEYRPTIESAINFYAPEAIPVITEAVRLLMNEGKSFDLELQLITAKQKKIWVRAIGQAYRINGEIMKVGGMFQDINELKLEKEALYQSYAFSESLLKTIPFGMDIVDEEGTVLFQSDNFKSLYGVESIGKKCWDLYCDNKTQCSDCPLKRGITIGETRIYESQGILGNRIFEIIHTGMKYQQKNAILEIFHDITDVKEKELELIKAREQAEQSDRLKTAFLAI
jgi:PAS domain S-box-containing protein